MAKKLIRSSLLVSALCLLSLPGCIEQSVRAGEAVSESSKPYVVLLVFSDPRCGACRRDEPVVASMGGKVPMIFLGWRDRYEVKYYKVRSVPAYILLTNDENGLMQETWRTNSAAEARDKLGLSP